MVQCIPFFTLCSLVLFGRALSAAGTLGAIARISGPQNVTGLFRFSTLPDSDDVKVVISMPGLLQYNMPYGFGFHIHQKPIAPDGNCSSALGHFKVWNVKPSCHSQNPEFCQPAELALRHGNLTGLVDKFTLRYNDSAIYLSGPDTIIGRSIVIHGAAMSHLACGSIVPWTPTETF